MAKVPTKPNDAGGAKGKAASAAGKPKSSIGKKQAPKAAFKAPDESKTPKPKKDRKPAAAPAPVEVDFPRGGGTTLTAGEYTSARREGLQAAEAGTLFADPPTAAEAEAGSDQPLADGAQAKKKRKLADRKDKRAGVPGAGKSDKKGKARADGSAHIKDALRVEHLNYKRLVPGLRLAGLVVSIKALELIVALPNQLVGHVPITQVSKYYTKRLEEEADDEEGSEEEEDGEKKPVKGLEELFRVGQWVQCVVVSTQTSSAGGSTRSSALQRAASRVTLSLDPSLLNASIPRTDLGPNFVCSAAVKSREDRGYVLDLGLQGTASTAAKKAGPVEAFVPFVQAAKLDGAGDGKDLEIGQVVLCKIVKIAENGRTCTVALDPKDIASAQLASATTLDAPLPLHLVPCLVTAVIPGAGLNVKFLGFYDGTVDLFHLGLDGSGASLLEDKYKVGQKIKARVLYDQVSGDVEGPKKKFALSALPHVVRLSPGAPFVGATEEAKAFPIGYTFASVQVTRVADEWGIVCKCVAGEDGSPLTSQPTGFAHISALTDAHLPSLTSTSAGPYRVGTTHRARVVGSSQLDGTLQLSLQPSVLERRFLKVSDVTVGEKVDGKVKRLTDGGMFLEISGSVDGVVWPLHFADIKLKHPERKFKPGQTVKARIFAADPDRNRVALTLKKTLLNSELPVFAGIGDVKVGAVVHAVVTKVMEKGLLVDFFGGGRGLVPIGEAAEAYTESLAKRISLGQVVQVKIIRVDASEGKVTASIRQALPGASAGANGADLEPTGSVDVGDKVEGTVIALHADNLVLHLRPGDAKGLIAWSVLAKRRGATVDDLRLTTSKGDVISDLLVTRKNEERGIAIVGFAQQTKAPPATGISSVLAMDSLLEGQKLDGKVLQKLPAGVIVQISRNLRGRIAWTDLSDDYDSVAQGEPLLNTLLPCSIVGLDPERGRIDLVSRPSLVDPATAGAVKDRYVDSISDIRSGDTIRGIVKNISDSGLFVAIGREVTARVQIKNLFDDYVKDWKPRFAVGQAVSGTILSVDAVSGKVEMTLRTESSSAQTAQQQRKVGLKDFAADQVVDAVVKGVEAYGAFLRIEGTGVSGLCHKSQIVEDLDAQDWKKAIKEGQKVKAVVLSVDLDKNKIAFSVRPSLLVEHGIAEDGEEEDDSLDDEELEDMDFLFNGRGGSDDDEEGDLDNSDDDVEVDLGEGALAPEGDGDDDEDVLFIGGEDESASEGEAPAPSTNGVKQAKATSTLPLSGGFSWSGEAVPTAVDEELEDDSDDSDESADPEEGDDEEDRSAKRRKISSALVASAAVPAPSDVGPTSIEDFQRLLLGAPDSSFLWIQLMSFHLRTGDVISARATARRAVGLGEAGEGTGIEAREDEERWNVWAAWLGLEVTYGTDEDVDAVFTKACGACEAKHVWLKLAELYESAGKLEKASFLYARLVKKFSQSSKAWSSAAAFALAHPEATTASDEATRNYDGTPVSGFEELLKRAMKSLERRKHVKTVLKFAQLEFKIGSPERGRTLFEGLVASFAKRTDLWNVYIDMETTHGGGGPESFTRVRGLFDRMLGLGLNAKKSKFVFKKWLAFEEKHGSEADQEEVKTRARDYVLSLAGRQAPAEDDADGVEVVHADELEGEDEDDEE